MTIEPIPTPADEAPPVDTGSPQILGQTPLNAKGEPRKSGPKGGRPRKIPADGTTASATPTRAPAGNRTDPNVNQAINTLATAYDMLTAGLMMVGARQASSELSAKIPAVQAQNRQFLQADPKLAARIATIGSSTGRAGFLVTNVMMLAGVGMTAAVELGWGQPKPTTRGVPVPKPTPNDPTVFDVETGEPTTPAASPLFPGGVG